MCGGRSAATIIPSLSECPARSLTRRSRHLSPVLLFGFVTHPIAVAANKGGLPPTPVTPSSVIRLKNQLRLYNTHTLSFVAEHALLNPSPRFSAG